MEEIAYEIFLSKIAAWKKANKKTNADIAALTGYKKSTIEAFMGGGIQSERVADAIATATGIER